MHLSYSLHGRRNVGFYGVLWLETYVVSLLLDGMMGWRFFLPNGGFGFSSLLRLLYQICCVLLGERNVL